MRQFTDRYQSTLRYTAGFTLVEVLIATAIFATAVTVALGALTSVNSLSKTIDRRNDLVTESQAIFKAMSYDIALSGWATYDTTAGDFANSYGIDRTLRYYPYVVQQAATGPAESARTASLASAGGGMQVASPTWFTSINTNWFLRAGNGLVDLGKFQSRPILPPQFGALTDFGKNYNGSSYGSEALRDKAYRASFYARSQELIYLRASVGGWSPKPGIDTTPIIKFPVGDWKSATKTTPTGLVKDNHEALGVIRMSEWLLGDTNPTAAPAVGTPDTRNPSSFFWNRPSGPAGLKQIPVAVNLGAMLSPQADPGNLVQVRWDSMLDPAAFPINMSASVLDDQHAVIEFPASAAGNARIKSRQLREYAYVLVPSPTGAGRLVRAHSEIGNVTVVTGRAPWVGDCIGTGTDPAPVAPATLGSRTISFIVDKVYTDNCMRVVFDTIRSVTDGSLEPNQVRVTLYLAIGDNRPGDVPITYQISTILTMRVLNSSVDNDSMTSLLGVSSPGLAH